MLKTFYIDYDISIKDQLLETLSKYSGITEYLLSHEQYNSAGEEKPHFHFFLKVDNIKTFNNVVKKIKEDYNLIELGKQIREKTGKKGYRNYGVHKKEIFNEEYFKTYIAKDGNIWGNLPAEQIQTYIDNSFKSNQEKVFKEELYKYVKLNYLKDKYKDICVRGDLYSSKHRETEIQLCIMDYMRENESTITKTKVKNHFNYFLTKNRKYSLSDIYLLLDL